MKSKQSMLSACRFITLFFLLTTNIIQAQVNRQVFQFDKEKLQVDKISGYDVIRYENFDISTEVSAPQIPIQIVQLILPPGKKIAEISIISSQKEFLLGEYHLYPAQPPVPATR